jgi:hypothetical protein
MPLTSYSNCPSCTAAIELHRQGRLFACPVCHCEFRHNVQKWLIGIPLVIGFVVILWRVLHVGGMKAALLSTAAASVIISRMRTYIIVSAGRETTLQEQLSVPRARKESRWFLIMLFSLVFVILAILVWSIWSSL